MWTTAALALSLQSPVDVQLDPLQQCVVPGQSVEVQLVLSATGPESISAVDALIAWDPLLLQLDSAAPVGSWFFSGFLPDPDGINADTTDGEALFTLLASPALPQTVPPDLVAATFTFTALDTGQVELLPSSGMFAQTQVVGILPGQVVTGAIGPPAEIGTATATALEVVRLGTPPNPDAFRPGLTSPPILGQTWDPFVDHSSFLPGAVIDGLALTIAPFNIPLPPYGTLLVLPPVGIPLQIVTAGDPFQLPLPPKCSLAGAQLYTQAFSLDGLGDLLLTGALDITLGTL